MLRRGFIKQPPFVKIFKIVSPESTNAKATHCEVEFPLKVQELWRDKHHVIFNKPPLALSQLPDKRTWYNTHDYDPPVLLDIVQSCSGSILKDGTYEPSYYPIHRIDTPVSGGIVYAVNKQSAQQFSRNLRYGGNKGFSLTRKYVAKVGKSKTANECKEGLIKWNGAITYFQRVDNEHLILQLVTGKKHQIRKLTQQVLDSPIYNDLKYGGKKVFDSDFQIALHSAYIRTKIGFNIHEQIIPVPDGFRMIWGESVDQNGNFNEDITRVLKEDWAGTIKECLKKLKIQETKLADNQLIFVS